MKNFKLYYLLLGITLIFFCSCDKGYEVRFSNFYTEPMDSVVVGDNKVVFTDTELQASTEYRKINKGKYLITCISRSKKKFQSEFTVPNRGSGKRTIQIDGVSQISILEE